MIRSMEEKHWVHTTILYLADIICVCLSWLVGWRRCATTAWLARRHVYRRKWNAAVMIDQLPIVNFKQLHNV